MHGLHVFILFLYEQVDDSEKVDALQSQIDELEEQLRKERSENSEAKEEIADLEAKVSYLCHVLCQSKVHKNCLNDAPQLISMLFQTDPCTIRATDKPNILTFIHSLCLPCKIRSMTWRMS